MLASETTANATERAAGASGRTRKPRTRSAVTSGRRLFVDGDPNSAWTRRFADLVAGHVSDLGGAAALSAAQQSLIRRASAIECELEQMEGRLSKGEPVDIDVFTRSASHLRRILETLGIERKPRDVTPTLDSIMAEYAAAAAPAPAAEPAGESYDAGPVPAAVWPSPSAEPSLSVSEPSRPEPPDIEYAPGDTVPLALFKDGAVAVMGVYHPRHDGQPRWQLVRPGSRNVVAVAPGGLDLARDIAAKLMQRIMSGDLL